MQSTINTTASTAIATTPGSVFCEMDVQAGAGIAIGIFPALSALAAAEVVTASITRIDTGVVIGQSVFTNSGAGASTGGPIVVIAPIPVGMAGAISLSLFGSVATGNVLGSATAPMVLMTLP